MRKSPAAVGVAALCAVLLSGCQSSGDGTPSEPEISASPATKTVAGVRVPVLPLDAYTVDAQQQEELDRAVDQLAQTCMKAKGYTWPARLEQLGVPRSANERRYGVTDPEAVKVYGYQLAPPVGVTPAQLAEEARREKKRKALMTDALTKAYTGRSGKTAAASHTGGCRGKALKQLGLPQGGEALTAVDLAQQQSFQRTEADSRARAANAKWSACMKKAGYRYANPHVAAADPAWWTKGADPAAPNRAGAREIATAVADVRCKRQVDYVTVWQSVETTYQHKIIAANRKELDAVRQARRNALRKAHEVLS
ncbi:hypothetical protein AB0H97_14495 [Streptomyces sp. NPDC050788]|uniref:hypothetical protein n=1 Tax=Streptomyces sp. NPDC050788 TaxID=3155041 RepID=UPI0034216F2A